VWSPFPHEFVAAWRTDFFIGVDDDFPTNFAGQRSFFESLEGVQHQDDAALGVDDSGAIDVAVIQSAAFLKRVFDSEHGIHVDAEHDLLFCIRPFADVYHVAGSLGRGVAFIVNGLPWLGGNDFQFAAERRKCIRNPVADFGQSFQIVSAGVDVAEFDDQPGHGVLFVVQPREGVGFFLGQAHLFCFVVGDVGLAGV